MVKRLADDIQWTTDLGNAFLAQQSDVMDAVQRMRKKAQDKGNLKSTEQQKVETKVIESKSVIVVEQANPQVVYVPSYDPVVVYGPPIYPYPPIYYPPAGYYAAGMAISFGVGVMMGAFWSGGWGWGCGWGGNNNININNNNNFNRNTNMAATQQHGRNRPSQQPGRGGGGRGDASWKHNPQHRGGAPYGDRATADRFGGTARGDSLSNRQASARQQVGRQGGNLASNRGGGAGVSNRASGAGSVTELAVRALATGRAEAERIASEAGTSRAAVAETGMPSEEVPEVEGTADRARAPAAAAAPPAWDLAEAAVVEVVAVGGEVGGLGCEAKEIIGACDMKSSICERQVSKTSLACRRTLAFLSCLGHLRCAATCRKDLTRAADCCRCQDL